MKSFKIIKSLIDPFKKISIKFVKSFGIVILALALIYSLLWFGCSLYFQYKINQNYSKKLLGTENLFAIKFDFAKISGFPFSIAYKLDGFKEYQASQEINYSDPVKISFNFFNKNISISSTGIKTIGDTKFKILGDFCISTDIILSDKFREAIKSDNTFELINFVNNLNIYFSDTKIYNGDDLVYQLDISNQTFEMKDPPYYTSLEDLNKELPKYARITNKLRISHYTKNIQFPTSFANPAIYNFDNYKEIDYDFHYMSTVDQINLTNFFKNVLIEGNYNFNGEDISLNGDINYLSKLSENKNTLEIRSKLNANFGKNFKETLHQDFLVSIKNLEEIGIATEKASAIKSLKINFKNLVPDFEKFGDIEFDIKAEANYDLHNLKVTIDKLSFANKLYTIFINNDAEIKEDKIDHIKGVVALKQYKNLLHLFLDYSKVILNSINQDKKYIKADHKYRDHFIKTIRSISNYPKSTSEDIYFDIDVKKDLEKFGSVDFKSATERFQSLMLKILIEEAIAQGVNVEEIIKGMKK